MTEQNITASPREADCIMADFDPVCRGGGRSTVLQPWTTFSWIQGVVACVVGVELRIAGMADV